MREGARELTDAGWSALAARRWADARALFERAVAAGPQPEALEGLGWAAWWLDDADATFAARERAYRGHRAAGDDVAAARVAIWLAGDNLDFRAAGAAAAGWLARAHRLLEGRAPCPEHGWLAFYDAYVAADRDPDAARALAASAARLGRELAEPDLEMLGLALEGSALVATARVGEGMARLDEAAACALGGEARLQIAEGWTYCFLISACERVGELERAREWCERVAAFAQRHESAYLHGLCRTHYAAVQLWCGDWAGAEGQLLAAIADFERSRPPFAAAALGWLAELRRRQGRLREALELAERAGGATRALLCRAAVELDGGDARAAAELCERALRGCGEAAVTDRAGAVALLARARAALGEPDAARAALAELSATAELVGAAPLRAAAALAAGAVAAAAGQHERARVALEDAVDGYGACGAPYETAQARLELAAALAALGRPEAAARERRAARRALADLGAAGPARRPGARDGELTARESEVLALVAEGLTNVQIAERLVVSRHTVHRHVTNVLRKLGLPSRAAAAAHAARAGLLDE